MVVVVVVVLVGGRFLKCAPIGRTPPTFVTWFHPPWHPDKMIWPPSWFFLVGLRDQACRPLLIIHCPGLLHQISIGFVWVEYYSRGTLKNLIICRIKIISKVQSSSSACTVRASPKKSCYIIFEQPHVGVKQSVTVWRISLLWYNQGGGWHGWEVSR